MGFQGTFEPRPAILIFPIPEDSVAIEKIEDIPPVEQETQDERKKKDNTHPDGNGNAEYPYPYNNKNPQAKIQLFHIDKCKQKEKRLQVFLY